MNEITRIHLARVAYDAELEAKKELEAYERALRQHLEDADTLDDIEVRMSELLADRGVKPGGVITLDDVKAIREQLGEPSEFGEEKQPVEGGDEKPVKKLYRDLDNAILGGVMSGIAAYFRLDPTLVRIVGLVLVAVSFGTFLLAYILLWLLIPAAKTASQKLELAGKPLTLENINAIGEMKLSQTARTMRRVMLILAGLGAVGVVVASLIVVARIVLWNPAYTFSTVDFMNNPALFVAIAGVTFAMFMSVIAYGLLRRTWRRQFTFALLCMTIVGFVTFGMGAYGYIVQRNYSYNGMSQIYNTQKARQYTAPNMTGVKKLVVDSNVPVFYSIGQPTLSVTATEIFEPTFTVNGDIATLHYEHSGDAQIFLGGPALIAIEVAAGGLGYKAEGGLLSVVMGQGTSTTLRGSLDSLQVTLRGNGTALDAQQLVVNGVKMTKTSENAGESVRAQAWFANIGSLDITYPVSCTSSSSFSISVNNVAGSLIGNGQAIALPFQTGCFEVVQPRG